MNKKTLHRKRALSAALFVLLMNIVGMTNVLAQSFMVDDLYYSVNNDGGAVTNTDYGSEIAVAADLSEAVTSITPSGLYAIGGTLELPFLANEGYSFDSWTQDGTVVSTEAAYSFTVSDDRTVVANFTAEGDEYHWTPNSGSYANSASLVGIIQIDGEEQASTALEIGAFCGDECRGRVKPRYVSQSYIVFMSLYGNDGDEMTFRLYDHTLGQELDLSCASTVTFVANSLFGTLASPYVLNFVGNVTTYDITATANPSEGGTVTGAGNFLDGETCTLNAAANEGYTFINWTENGDVVSYLNPFSFTVSGDRDLVANFTEGSVCAITFELYDSYGDGYTGNYLVVSYGDVTEQFTVESGSSASYTLQIPDESHVELSWILGTYPGDCSFAISYSNGDVIYSGSNISSGFSASFDVDCEGMPTTPYIMTTNYDLQSNAALGNRIATWTDGTASFVATWDHSGNSSFPDRGTGYNYYDGNSFGNEPSERIESMRSGWPSIAACGNGEILASHASGVNVYYRPTKGQGEWTLVKNFPNVTWPRIVCSGPNDQYVHIVAADQVMNDAGIYISTIYYARSTDGGQTWSNMAEFPGLDNTTSGDYRNQISSDDYVMAANGNNVAVMFGSYTTDVFYMISHDNGQSWERQIVAPCPVEGVHAFSFDDYPNGMEYYINTSDNSHSIAIDDNGVVHVAFGLFRWHVTEPGYYSYIYSSGYGIVYWNSEYVNEQGGHEIPLFGDFSGDAYHYDWAAEGGGLGYSLYPDRIAALADADGHQHLHVFGHQSYYNFELSNKTWHYRTLGLATMPGISIDESGNMAIVYNVLSTDRINPTTNFPYRDAYVTCRDSYGTWFNNAINLSTGSNHASDEVYSTFASAKGNNGSFWVGYFADENQGLYLDISDTYPNSNGGVLTENHLYAEKITPDMEGWNYAYYQISTLASPVEGGYISGAGTYGIGTTCTLAASANMGYHFVNWTKNGAEVSTEPIYSFMVTENAEYVAHFECDALGEFTYMYPTNNYPFTTLPVTFTWDAVSGREYYDLYVWDAEEQMPEEPFVSDLLYGSYSTTALQNYHTYNWLVKARNACYEVTSSIRSFSLDITPSLNVNTTQINFGEVAMNQTTSTTLSVTGIVLEDTLNVQITGDDGAMFSFVKASGWNDYTGGILILTFNPTIPQYSYNASLVISSGAFTRTISLTGAVSNLYVFNTYVTEDVYAMNSQIPIYGSVTDWSDAPVADAEVEIGVFVMGMKRTLQAVTDNNGQFSAIFEPMPSESGYYTINSGMVGHDNTDVHDEFNIPGMAMVASDYVLCAVTQDQPKTDSILIRNKSNLPLNNIQVTTLSAPDGCSFSSSPLSLGGLEEDYLIYTVTGSTLTQGYNYQELRLKATSDEGAETIITIWYYCMAAKGVLDVAPQSIVTTMTKGKSKIMDVMLTNNGTAATGDITIDLPDVEWMSVVGSDTLPSLAVNDTAYFSLRFSPDDDIPLVQYSGTIAINSERGDFVSLPYTITAVSDSTGMLVVDVTDDFTWNTNNGNGPHLANAEVTLRGYYSLETVAQGYTDENGLFQVNDLPEGYYRLHVEADHHSQYDNNILVTAGETNNQSIYLQYQAITYSWTVEATEIEDEYTFELDVVYETNVPAPVVVIEISSQVPELEVGESYTFNAIVTNYGLIAAKDFQLIVPELSEYNFYPLFDFIDSLPALTTVVIPITVNRVQPGRYDYSTRNDDPCWARLGAMMYYVCGRDYEHNSDRYVWHYAYSREVLVNTCVLNALADHLPELPCFGCGGGNGSGGSGSGIEDYPPESNHYVVGCHPCDLILKEVALCLPVLSDLNYLAESIPGNQHSNYDHIIYWGGKIPDLGTKIQLAGCSGNLAAYIQCQLEHTFRSMSLEDFDFIFRLNDDIIEIYNEFYPNSLLYEKEGFELFNNLMLPYYSSIIEISESDAEIIKSNFVNLDIPFETIDNIINRWNQTVFAWNNDVFEPDVNHPNIINKVHLEDIGNDIAEIFDDVNAMGYDSMYDLAEDLYDIIEYEVGESSNSVCSTVTVRFSQKMTMTREAFEGTFTVHNGHDSQPMEAIGLDFIVKDEFGNDCTNLFQINTLSVNNITGIDGYGSLGAGLDGVAKIQFIPTKNAAPTEPKVYYFGGTFSFIDPYTLEELVYNLYPVELTVHPCPDLYVDYFMQRDILGDDALTLDKVEPSVPAELGVIINNKGAGIAKNVTLETAEPQIVDNEKGLAVDFAMYGASLNGSPRQLGLTEIRLGNIETGQTAVGEWLFTSSLLGHFVSYEAHVLHNSSYGNSDLSLVSHLDIHELIHPIYAYGNLDDGINDFLVNDDPDPYDQPDSIYFSNGGKTSVGIVDNISFDHYVEPLDTIVTLTINPSRIGWNYGVIDDPGRDKYELVSCTRNNDNQVIPLNNVWQTFVTLHDQADPIYENNLHIVDTLSNDVQDFSYTLVYQLKSNLLDVLEITGIPDSYIEYPLESFTVKFNEAIIDSTFTYEDMTLKCQNGPNLMDSTVVITKVSDSLYNVNISGLTNETGLYVLNVNTLNIKDIRGYDGYNGKQASWVQALTSHTQTSMLMSGWNWYSTYIEQTGMNGLQILEESLGANGVQIKSQQQYVNYYEGMGWMGMLNTIDNESSYKIKTSAACVVEMTGEETAPTAHPITIGSGWNWIGYPINSSMSVTTALSDITPAEGDQLKALNGYANYYNGMGWMGTLSTLEPGMGLLYKSNGSGSFTLVYPEGAKGETLVENISSDNNHWVPDMHAYPDNMTVTAIIELDNEEIASENYELAVFANGECRGSVRLKYVEPIGRHIAFLTITGEEVETLTFGLYDAQTGEEIYDTQETLNFSNNTIVGDVRAPYVLHFRGIMGVDEWTNRLNVFPNPVACGEVLNIVMPVEDFGKVRVEIINALGVVETVRTTALQSMTAPDVAGVYTLRITVEVKGTCYRKLVVR